jgi:hypothetical protein
MSTLFETAECLQVVALGVQTFTSLALQGVLPDILFIFY